MINVNLPIYGVPQKLKEYATSKKDVRQHIERLPPTNLRLYNEDIYKPIDYRIGSDIGGSSKIESSSFSD